MSKIEMKETMVRSKSMAFGAIALAAMLAVSGCALYKKPTGDGTEQSTAAAASATASPAAPGTTGPGGYGQGNTNQNQNQNRGS